MTYKSKSKKKPLLYVEDNKVYLGDWKKRLEKMGYLVNIARNNDEAKKMFDANPLYYELAFVDLGLPQKDEKNEYNYQNTDDPRVGLSLLEYFRGKNSSIGLIAVSTLPEISFASDLIAGLIANKISFAPIRFQIDNEIILRILWLSEKGFVVYPPGLSPTFKKLIAEPEDSPPLDEWEFYLLSLRAKDNTYDEISEITNIPKETIRADFRFIYEKLETHKMIPAKKGDRRSSLTLQEAFDRLIKKYGKPPQTTRPRRRSKPNQRNLID